VRAVSPLTQSTSLAFSGTTYNSGSLQWARYVVLMEATRKTIAFWRENLLGNSCIKLHWALWEIVKFVLSKCNLVDMLELGQN
jgi:hypothetical protein